MAELGRLGRRQLTGRERLLLAALAAGIARRSGDIARLRDAWAGVEPVLARRAVDLFAVEAVEELAVAAARLRRHGAGRAGAGRSRRHRGRPGPAAGLGGGGRAGSGCRWPSRPRTPTRRPPRRRSSCRRGSARRPAPRQRAQCAAARDCGRGCSPARSTPTPRSPSADGLAAAELPWEASRLVGQAAIRTTDPAAARRLLERARELSSAEVAAGERPGRERSTAACPSARSRWPGWCWPAAPTGRSAARLFISPKTVEHHVARIRTKLGATTRAEFVAALRTVLDAADLAG